MNDNTNKSNRYKCKCFGMCCVTQPKWVQAIVLRSLLNELLAFCLVHYFTLHYHTLLPLLVILLLLIHRF
jgi:hypothetical protein